MDIQIQGPEARISKNWCSLKKEKELWSRLALFSPQITVISKKKDLHFDFISDFPILLPKSWFKTSSSWIRLRFLDFRLTIVMYANLSLLRAVIYKLLRPIRVVFATHIRVATHPHSLSDSWFEKRSFKGQFPLRAWKKAFFVCFIDFFCARFNFNRSLQSKINKRDKECCFPRS